MDGNGRWAKSRKLNRIVGHKKAVDTVRDTVTACRKLGINVLTLYAFSEENWKRPAAEIRALMELLKKFLVSERKLLIENDIRLRTIGNTKKLPKNVQKTLEETLTLTQDHQSMDLVLALSYGGREEITRAVQKICTKVKKGELSPKDISESTITSHLDTAGLPDPDLLIRTSGEFRTSNFLPWQGIYTEIYITPTLWPNFSTEDLHEALREYGLRERRFGLTSEQISQSGEHLWKNAR